MVKRVGARAHSLEGRHSWQQLKKDDDADFARVDSNEEVVGDLERFCSAVMKLVLYVEQAAIMSLSTGQQWQLKNKETDACICGDGLLLESCIDCVTNRAELPIDLRGRGFCEQSHLLCLAINVLTGGSESARLRRCIYMWTIWTPLVCLPWVFVSCYISPASDPWILMTSLTTVEVLAQINTKPLGARPSRSLWVMQRPCSKYMVQERSGLTHPSSRLWAVRNVATW